MLYKYGSVSERSLRSLSDRTLYAQHFTRFNDPFECGALFLAGQIDRETEPARFAAMLQAWGFNDPNTAPIEGTDEYFEQFESYNLKLALPGVRICCFASEVDNLLMWSHYAGGLRGFCLELDETVISAVIGELPGFPLITDVAYTDEPPTVDGMVLGVLDDQIDYAYMCFHEEKDDFWLEEAKRLEGEVQNLYRQGFATKPKAWSYERERRLIVQTDQHDMEPLAIRLPSEAVRSVILGELMPSEDRARIEEIVAEEYPVASVRTARRKLFTYKLTIE
ncbi:DUF2971 domain-containing protein [Mesorhizobium sp.]|uniref:DUF2971 domain-containing protein n=1 Tax=Mesorhizobium sp. TaxID=1871066 RepID=UPI000FE8F610|nr:DUF2971 domain-containing protein [Mesorhizobium sp.]RWQ16138.1 MAG: DUF2971 domain-containing protein [Mesorhizobium sp.]